MDEDAIIYSDHDDGTMEIDGDPPVAPAAGNSACTSDPDWGGGIGESGIDRMEGLVAGPEDEEVCWETMGGPGRSRRKSSRRKVALKKAAGRKDKEQMKGNIRRIILRKDLAGGTSIIKCGEYRHCMNPRDKEACLRRDTLPLEGTAGTTVGGLQ
jgi:hypothetical protein